MNDRPSQEISAMGALYLCLFLLPVAHLPSRLARVEMGAQCFSVRQVNLLTLKMKSIRTAFSGALVLFHSGSLLASW